jgi:hypothetical protein
MCLLVHNAADQTWKCRFVRDEAERMVEHNDGLLGKVRRGLMASDAEAKRGIEEAIKFLWLVAADRSHGWTPSHRIDLVWHEMILFTRGYERFCRECLGGFVHHQPSDNHVENRRAFESTLIAYRNWFGDPDELFWGRRGSAVANCGACDAVGE